MYSSFNLNLFV